MLMLGNFSKVVSEFIPTLIFLKIWPFIVIHIGHPKLLVILENLAKKSQHRYVWDTSKNNDNY